jgi:hypothetical protein
MRHEFPGRCPGLVYDALSELLDVPADQAYDRTQMPADSVTDPV